MLQSPLKKAVCICFFTLIFLGQKLYAQTDVDTTTNELVEPLEDTVIDTVAENESSTKEKFKGDFTLIDTNNVISITNGRISLKDTIQSLKKSDDYWYADGVEEKKEIINEKPSSFWQWLAKLLNNKVFRVLSWIIIIGILLFLVIAFLRSNGIGLFTSGARKIKSAAIEEEIADNIFEIDFEAAIAKSIQSQDYCLATRYLFLRLLKGLANKNIIEYAPDKTNFDYLFALSGTIVYNDFALAVKNYEYVWYGDFTITNQQFLSIQTQFDKLQQFL
jgi:hypothetical protein